MKASIGESPRKLTAGFAYLIALCSSPMLIIFYFVGGLQLGFGAWICLTFVMLVVRIRWDLRRHVWFWITIGLTLLLQIPLVLVIPWNDRNLTWFILLPVAILDYAVVYGCVRFVEKLMKKEQEAISPQ
jgi:hypothetical protein